MAATLIEALHPDDFVFDLIDLGPMPCAPPSLSASLLTLLGLGGSF